MNRKKTILIFILILMVVATFLTVHLVQERQELRKEAAPATTMNVLNSPFNWEFGKVETVFDYDDKAGLTTRCSENDLPDTVAKAFVDADGKVQLLSTHIHNRRFIGDNLSQVTHPCQIIMDSDGDGIPRNYNDKEWLNSFYTLDGNTIYSLIHTEYHGWEHGNCNSSNAVDCWWNSINLAISTDKGQNYRHSIPTSGASSQPHNIANTPVDYDPNNKTGVIGHIEPSNIVKKDGFYYFLTAFHDPDPNQRGICLARTSDLADPKSWRFWDGSAFTISGDGKKSGQKCKPLSPSPVHINLTYNNYLKKYFTLSCGWVEEQSKRICWFSLSDDLIHWTEQYYISPTDPIMCFYPSLIQPGDPTRNFEQTNRSPWVYFVRSGNAKTCLSMEGYNRDLMRVRVRFSRPEDKGKFELLDLRMNERIGNKTLDSSFYINDGNLIGNVSFVQEGEKNFLRFNSDGKVEIPHNDSLNVSGQFTIQAKIRVSSAIPTSSFPTIIKKEAVGIGRNYGLYLTDQGFLHFSFTNSNGLTGSLGTKRINDGQWHQVTVVYDDTTGMARYYVDDQFDVARYHGGKPESGINSSSALIGDQNFAGDIDFLTLYNYGITVSSPTKTCSVSLPKTTFAEGENIPFIFSGSNISGSENVRLSMKRQNTLKISGFTNYESVFNTDWCPFGGDGIKEYFDYTLTHCTTTNGVACSGSKTITLPPGEYTVHCDLATPPGKCSGSFTCNYKGCNPAADCKCYDCTAAGWVSCGPNDMATFTVKAPVPTPTLKPTATPTLKPTTTQKPTATPTPRPTNTPTPTPTPTPKPGDITGDGKVDEADYAVLMANFGKLGNRSQGDLTGDGKINEADYAVLMANLGK